MAEREFTGETSEGPRKKGDQKHSTLGLETVEVEEIVGKKKRWWIMQARREKEGCGTKSKPRYRRTEMGASHWFWYRRGHHHRHT